MNILLHAVRDTLSLLWQVLPVMFAGLFGVEVLVRLGLMNRLESIGRPLARIAHLPSQSVPAFLTSIGSLAAAMAMLAGHHADKRITDRELVLGSVFNTIPLHFKETLTYQLPVILPLLGIRLCLIYIATFWLTAVIKLGYVAYYGRKTLARKENVEAAIEADAATLDSDPKTFACVVRDAFIARWGLFSRMAVILMVVTMIVQLLVHAGALNAFEALIAPAADILGLPAVIVAPVSVYIVSPIVGIGAMSTLLHQHLVTEYQAIVALLAGGFLMVPLVRLRGTLPRYVSILGWKNGSRVLTITTVLSLVARGIVLGWVFLFFS